MELDKNATITIYEGIGHAFANSSGTNNQPDYAKDAWDETLIFFHKYLH